MFRFNDPANSTIETLEPRRLLSIDFAWGIGGGGTGKAHPSAVIMDRDGSVYVAGAFSGSMDVDPSKNVFKLVAGGDSDLFVIKYSPAGKLIWAQTAGGGDGEIVPTGMTFDGFGGLVVVGSFKGKVDFAPGPSTVNATSAGGEDAFILRLSVTKGKYDRMQNFGGPNDEAIRGVTTVDENYTFYVGGVFDKLTLFPQATKYTHSAGGKDGFLMRFAWGQPSQQTVQIVGGKGDDSINGIAYDQSIRRICVVGSMEQTASMGRGPTADASGNLQTVYLTSHGGADAFYARYKVNLDPATGRVRRFANIFAQRYGGNGNETGESLTVGDSVAYIAGTFSKPMYGLTAVGGRDIFVKRIEGGIRQIGSTADDSSPRLAMDSGGPLMVAGAYGAPMKVNGVSLPNAGKTDVFIATYDYKFAPETAASIGGVNADDVASVAFSNVYNFCLAGSFRRTIDLGPGNITAILGSKVASDMWIDRLTVPMISD